MRTHYSDADKLFCRHIHRKIFGTGGLRATKLCWSLHGLFASVCTLGINSVIVKELVDNRKNEGTVLGTSMLLRAMSSILSAIGIFCIVFVADNSEPVTIAVVALCSLGMIFNLLETFNYWFQSRLESKITAIATLAGYMITATYKVFLIVTQKSVVFFALATSLDYIVVGVILICFYKAKKVRNSGFRRTTEKNC